MARSELGSTTIKLNLLINHFKMNLTNPVTLLNISHNTVLIFLILVKGIELNDKDFAYDGSKALLTLGSLSQKDELEFDVVLKDVASNRGGFRLGRNYFPNDDRRLDRMKDDMFRALGKFASFRTTQTDLYLNIDMSTTIVFPPTVLDFLAFNQNTTASGLSIDWKKATETLQNLRIQATHSKREYVITRLSDLLCEDKMFSMKKKMDGIGEVYFKEISVFKYFTERKAISLTYSDKYPCVNVRKPNILVYLPIELCMLSLKRYIEDLQCYQQASFVMHSRLSPQRRKAALSHYQISDRVGKVVYRVALPSNLANLHDVFHVSQLRKYVSDPSHVIQIDDVQVRDNLTVEMMPVRIVDREMKVLRGKEFALVKVVWLGAAGESSA
ncbi:protein argonaute 8-like [Vicia villosa]|uniref:protein argonaute 8-like n=1 Tax=Vicia villosa TaxID=3911 RepID=UPI00273C035B|nr:protein argonaute 8-like [Vicia villosa]